VVIFEVAKGVLCQPHIDIRTYAQDIGVFPQDQILKDQRMYSLTVLDGIERAINGQLIAVAITAM
jgi:hypothetical protein